MSSDTTIAHPAESELVEGLRTGSRDSFRKFYGRYAPMVLGIISRNEPDKKAAEHLLQMVFIEIWNNKHTIGSQPVLTWLLHIVRKITHLHAKNSNTAQNQNTSSFVDVSKIKDPAAAYDMQKLVLEDVYINGLNIKEATEKWQIGEDELKIMLRNAVKPFKNPAQ